MRLLGSFDLFIGMNGLVSAVAGSSTAVSLTNGALGRQWENESGGIIDLALLNFKFSGRGETLAARDPQLSLRLH